MQIELDLHSFKPPFNHQTSLQVFWSIFEACQALDRAFPETALQEVQFSNLIILQSIDMLV
jgi:hypothetical protein